MKRKKNKPNKTVDDVCDKSRSGKYVNIYRYEQAKQIHQKVHDEYCKRIKEREG